MSGQCWVLLLDDTGTEPQHTLHIHSSSEWPFLLFCSLCRPGLLRPVSLLLPAEKKQQHWCFTHASVFFFSCSNAAAAQFRKQKWRVSEDGVFLSVTGWQESWDAHSVTARSCFAAIGKLWKCFWVFFEISSQNSSSRFRSVLGSPLERPLDPEPAQLTLFKNTTWPAHNRWSSFIWDMEAGEPYWRQIRDELFVLVCNAARYDNMRVILCGLPAHPDVQGIASWVLLCIPWSSSLVLPLPQRIWFVTFVAAWWIVVTWFRCFVFTQWDVKTTVYPTNSKVCTSL